MYSSSLKMLIRQIGKSLADETDPQRIITKLKQIAAQPVYQDYCDAIALKFITQINNVDAKTWREAARKASRGSDIYAAITKELAGSKNGAVFSQKVRENAKLIKTQPYDLAEDFTKYIGSEALRGRRAKEIGKDILAQYPEKSEHIIQRIARTETSKAQTALTQARASAMTSASTKAIAIMNGMQFTSSAAVSSSISSTPFLMISFIRGPIIFCQWPSHRKVVLFCYEP